MKFILVILLTCISSTLLANNKVSVVVGLSKPPYVIKERNTGFEIELVREIFLGMGLSVNFIYTNYGHSLNMLNVEGIDAVMTTNNKVFEQEKLSDVYITYQNVAISLKSNNYSITSIADLAKYSIASFQQSKKVLGQEFDKAATQSPLFMEISNQESQPGLLTKERIQLAVMDKNIFNHYLKAQKLPDEFTFHPVFPSNPYRMAFRKTEYITRFNQSLKKFLSSDKYDELLRKYKL